ncbi:MAG: metal-dependent hydrolase [Candidatus Bathyarchaeia archaeon]|nr:metal-dependent hydrolase [Candidatus Bathyarchaeota archaeon]
MAKATWFGHAAFKLELADKTVLIDPWLDGNPTSPIKASEIDKADIVYVTHDHGDHLGDAIAICKRTGATFVSTFELGNYASESGVPDVVGLNIGGSVEIKGIKLHVVHAFHTCSRGAPTGVIVEGEDKTVYHAGDTGLFGDLKFIGQFYKPNLALLPIGGYYTMGASEAAEAVKLLKPKSVIPMHYKTFPVLAQSADEFVERVKKKAPRIKIVVLNPGESFEF